MSQNDLFAVMSARARVGRKYGTVSEFLRVRRKVPRFGPKSEKHSSVGFETRKIAEVVHF